MKLVIEVPDKIYNTFHEGNWSVTYDDILDYLEQKSCEDCISREAVNVLVDELARAISDERIGISRGRSTATIMRDILHLPSVNPKKVGKWIATGVDGEFECSCCQNLWQDAEENTYDDWIHIAKFCPCCGAEMGGTDEDSD